MQEYLNTKTYEYKLANEMPEHGEWVKIPKNANYAGSVGCGVFFSEKKEFMPKHVVWQRPTQPEALPFIDDEPQSLNEQYAEIEQVRQQSIEATLAERQSTYGSFEDVAFVTENIMSVLGHVRVNGLSELPNTHRMALYMIASKMARIVNGDFNFIESWHDISGYAKLIENELMQTDGATNSRVIYQVVKDGVLEDKNES